MSAVPASLWDCEHAVTQLTLRRIRGGGIQYVQQCLRCGGSVGSAVPHAKVQTLPPEWDEPLHDRWIVERQRWYESERQAIFDGRERELNSRRSRYEAYLETSQWKQKRAAVLQRERFICQGCASNRACDVHHLTYDHLGKELLFELVALCRSCHDVAHGLDEAGDQG